MVHESLRQRRLPGRVLVVGQDPFHRDARSRSEDHACPIEPGRCRVGGPGSLDA